MDVIKLARIDLSSSERVEHERIVRVGTVGYMNVSLHRSLRIAEMKNGFSSSRAAAQEHSLTRKRRFCNPDTAPAGRQMQRFMSPRWGLTSDKNHPSPTLAHGATFLPRSAAIPPRTRCRSNALLPATPLQQREPAGSHCSLAASRQDPRPPSTRPAPTAPDPKHLAQLRESLPRPSLPIGSAFLPLATRDTREAQLSAVRDPDIHCAS